MFPNGGPLPTYPAS